MPNQAAVQVQGFASNYAAGTCIKRHSHKTHQVVHAISGVMRVRAENGIWVLPPGRGLWVPARTPHAIRCSGLVRMRTTYLQGDDAFFPLELRVIGVSALMREIMVRLAEHDRAGDTPLLIAVLISEIAGSDVQPLRLPVPGDKRLARLVSRFLADPTDATTLVAWADRLAMSERTLIRSIRRETGLSFRELRRQARIIASIEKLVLGQPVTHVALDVGFESPSAFIQSFRRVTGSTPGRYLLES